MFADLRYHLVSLAAVFLALSVGMLIGGLFLNTAPAETQQRLIRRIQEDLARITSESDRNRRDFERMEQAMKELMPQLVKQRLKARRIAVVQTGEDDRALADTLKSLRDAGAEIVSVTVVNGRWLELSDEEKQRIIRGLRALKPHLPEDFSAVVKALANGVALLGYEQTIEILRREGLIRTSGDYTSPCRYVVVVGGSSVPESQRAAEIDRPLIRQWKDTGVEVVATERRDCALSHVAVYQETDIASVDCIDTALGQMVLPFLFEAKTAAYGVKDSAERVLPDTLLEAK
ncbi:MAG: copper transporter [Armatimonadota bacterium]|nr:copper transporter [bacterium]MDW8320600.1 copper transporter [Armatimonadota bacterium]